MKVGELLEYLKDQNPEAAVVLYANNTYSEILAVDTKDTALYSVTIVEDDEEFNVVCDEEELPELMSEEGFQEKEVWVAAGAVILSDGSEDDLYEDDFTEEDEA